VPPVRIENRAQLIYLLTEAAELEHNILCCYLFNAFSMKDDTNEGVTEEQLARIREWRALIMEVAVEEMIHLASACNLLTAVGGAPQLRRPSLPTSPRAYPDVFKLALVPFSLQALEIFMDIERPEGLPPINPALAEDEDKEDDFSLGSIGAIFSSEREYKTQGSLYRGIEDGIHYLAQKYGEEGLFIGPADAQTADKYFGNYPGLIPVTNLESALEAINVIVEQGEGAAIETEDSHYSKFRRIYLDYKDILKTDPNFQPARPVAPNPYATLPTDKPDTSELAVIEDPMTKDLANLFDGCYELMVQMLGRLFVHAEETESELISLANTTLGIMVDVIVPLGSALTLMPIGPSHPGKTAGPSFRLSRGASIPTSKTAAWVVFHERLSELNAYCRYLQTQKNAPAVLGKVSDALSRLVDFFSKP
jgi:rubrerythrin